MTTIMEKNIFIHVLICTYFLPRDNILEGHRVRIYMATGFMLIDDTICIYTYSGLLVQLLPDTIVLDTNTRDQICKYILTGPWFFVDAKVSSVYKTDPHDITEILLKVLLNTHDP
jgi:hypothetical protein